ncbi:uncharacterized protein LOC110251490 [Exaiptasia diaphana]|uniref:Uncharacterized protein n=1 Tax=Exaiptasia diaphana TaxID=2652724 RepID=A0A913Y3G2_EXADI|nr:uncharacterized protein LOC110251490 [Exaiptasia diaphana]
MPLFKTRSAKIEPFNGTNELETIDVENTHPRMELFVKVSSSNSHDSAKRRLVLSERMDDPEEVCELSPLSLYFIQQENHLDISSIKDQQVFFRRSMDFCQKDFPPPPNFQPTRTNHAGKAIRTECDGSFYDDVASPVWKKNETSVCVDRSLCKGTRWLLKDVDKTAHLKYKLRYKQLNAIKSNDLHTWTCSPDRFYNYISKVKHARSKNMNLTIDTADERLKHSLLSNSNGRRVRFPADVLVFACVLENLSEDLELVLRYSNVDLNAYLNARDLSPLHVAALLGNTECIQVLLRYGANVHCLDNSGHSPLYKAFSGHHFECAVLLIEHGANINHFTRQKIKEVERLKKKSKLYKRDDLED